MKSAPLAPEEDVIGLDAISGATVTVIAQNQVVMMSGAAVARQTGIIQPTVRDPARFAVTGKRYDWAQLMQMGAVQRLVVTPEQVGLRHVAPSRSSNCGSATSTTPTWVAACWVTTATTTCAHACRTPRVPSS